MLTIRSFLACLIALTPTLAWSQSPVTLTPIGEQYCQLGTPGSCGNGDAIVFVHGIYGNNETFLNPRTGFDWPLGLARNTGLSPPLHSNYINVFQLSYHTKLIAWARGSNPSFKELAVAINGALKPLRVAGYRSIGFIAHSLGGNLVSTYIHEVKSQLGHPQRAQHAFVITLATPVLGSQFADLAGALKSILGMSDGLLSSLRRGNLYLEMLQHFREEEDDKGARYACRPVHLHAAVEAKYLGPLLIVSPGSSARPISTFVKSPIVGFPLDHSAIAKPRNLEDGIYRWVFERLEQEYLRLNTWGDAHHESAPERRLCDLMDYIPEKP